MPDAYENFRPDKTLMKNFEMGILSKLRVECGRVARGGALRNQES
jgi:hypothetical protein